MNKLMNTVMSLETPILVKWDSYFLNQFNTSGVSNIYGPVAGGSSRYSTNPAGGKISPTLISVIRLIMEQEAPLNQNLYEERCAVAITKQGYTVAEYSYTSGVQGIDEESCVDLVIYNPSKKTMSAAKYHKTMDGSDKFDAYVLSDDECNGKAILLALYPHISADSEFSELYDKIHDVILDPAKADHDFFVNAAKISSNVVARIDSGSIPVSASTLGISMLRQKVVEDQEITEEKYGQLTLFGKKKGSEIPTFQKTTEMNGKFAIDGVVMEGAAIMNDDYLLPEQVIELAMDVNQTAKAPKKINTFLMEGPAGSGKSEGARALAAMLGKPYVAFSCCSDTSAMDILGSFVPSTAKKEIPDIPSYGDMKFDPEGSYERLTGKKLEGTTSLDELFDLAFKKLTEVKKDKDFEFVPSPILEGLKANAVVEVQEADHIVIPNTLTILNNIIEGGEVMAPNGVYYKRGPSSVLVFTINKDYVENRPLATSLKSRCNETIVLDTPSVDILVERAMARTGCKDESFVRQLAEKVHDISAFCKEQGLTDGSCGFRELIDWISCSMYANDPIYKAYKRARCCVINSATSDDEARESIVTTFFDGVEI